MKVLVDTSVWIDYFRGTATDKVAQLDELIRQREDICCCGFVLTEVLQGIRDDHAFATTRELFDGLLYLEADRATFEQGAGIYRALRRKGATIRSPIDCLIAATVRQHGVHLLENDRDFQAIDEYFRLNRL
jgi:predicted nucleic acid-binding protein